MWPRDAKIQNLTHSDEASAGTGNSRQDIIFLTATEYAKHYTVLFTQEPSCQVTATSQLAQLFCKWC